MSKWWNGMGKADTALSIGEWVFRVAALVGVSTGGIAAWFLARFDPFFSGKNPLYWYAIALVTSLVVAGTLWLAMSAITNRAIAKYYDSLSIPKGDINPLDKVFENKVIAIEDLRLPLRQVHVNKHFTGCKFVGAGAMAIVGGSIANSEFNNNGHMVALPDGTLTPGLVTLLNCTIDNCEFVRLAIFVDQGTAKAFKANGADVKGILS